MTLRLSIILLGACAIASVAFPAIGHLALQLLAIGICALLAADLLRRLMGPLHPMSAHRIWVPRRTRPADELPRELVSLERGMREGRWLFGSELPAQHVTILRNCLVERLRHRHGLEAARAADLPAIAALVSQPLLALVQLGPTEPVRIRRKHAHALIQEVQRL